MQPSYHTGSPVIPQQAAPHAGTGTGIPSQAYGLPGAAQPLHDPYVYSYDASYGATPPAVSQSSVSTWFQFSDSGYLKGFLIGAGVTLLLTNSTVQKTLVRGAVKLWSLAQGGVEEVKEQFRDIKAEMSQEKE